ncbi:MAG: rhomboid family intramembrane serine protease [Bacteroidota bacterium]
MSKDRIKFQESIYFTMSFVMLLWLMKYIETASSIDFSSLGILPRTLEGSLGILTSPLVHGDFFHLFSNTFPLIFSGVATFYFYRRVAPFVFLIIYFFTGIMVWLFARNAYHIGASGLIYGLVSFLFFSGIFRKDLPAVAIALIVVFLYNGMFLGLFPSDDGVSWETHSIGAFIGFICSFSFRKIDYYRNHIQKAEEDTEPQTDVESPFEADNTYDNEGVNFTYTYQKKKDQSDH